MPRQGVLEPAQPASTPTAGGYSGMCGGKTAYARQTGAGWQVKIPDPTDRRAGHDGWLLIGTGWPTLADASAATGLAWPVIPTDLADTTRRRHRLRRLHLLSAASSTASAPAGIDRPVDRWSAARWPTADFLRQPSVDPLAGIVLARRNRPADEPRPAGRSRRVDAAGRHPRPDRIGR
jgi:hypothetical protein